MQATLNQLNSSINKNQSSGLEILTSRNIPRSLDKYVVDNQNYQYGKSGPGVQLESVSQRMLNNKKNLSMIQNEIE